MRLNKTRSLALAGALAGAAAWVQPAAAWAETGKGGRLGAKAKGEYGPLFEDDAACDTRHASAMQRGKKPMLSVGGGSFCFLDGGRCKASLLISAGVGAGLRVPASDS